MLLLHSLFEAEVFMCKKLDLPFSFVHFASIYPDTPVLDVLDLYLMIYFNPLILYAQALDSTSKLFLLLLIIIYKVLEPVQQDSESILHLIISLHECLGFTLVHLGFSAHGFQGLPHFHVSPDQIINQEHILQSLLIKLGHGNCVT
jgi:hypothetical protein